MASRKQNKQIIQKKSISQEQRAKRTQSHPVFCIGSHHDPVDDRGFDRPLVSKRK